MIRNTLIAAALLAASPLASAAAGDWVMKVGVHAVDPKSDNGTVAGTLAVDVGTDAKPSIMFEYFLSDHWGVEVLAALPFRHDVELDGTKAASLKHLPPTVSLQYHFAPDSTVSPYIGLGVNFTTLFSIDTTGPLAGTDLDLDDSFGLAAHAGIDFRINDRWSLGVDVRKLDIDADAKLDGADIGTVNVDPLAYGLYLGYRF